MNTGGNIGVRQILPMEGADWGEDDSGIGTGSNPTPSRSTRSSFSSTVSATSSSQSSSKANIFVKGIDGRTTKLDVELTTTIEQVKLTIQQTLSIPYESQRLVYSGRTLEQGVLRDYNVANNSTIELTSHMKGGRKN